MGLKTPDKTNLENESPTKKPHHTSHHPHTGAIHFEQENGSKDSMTISGSYHGHSASKKSGGKENSLHSSSKKKRGDRT